MGGGYKNFTGFFRFLKDFFSGQDILGGFNVVYVPIEFLLLSTDFPIMLFELLGGCKPREKGIVGSHNVFSLCLSTSLLSDLSPSNMTLSKQPVNILQTFLTNQKALPCAWYLHQIPSHLFHGYKTHACRNHSYAKPFYVSHFTDKV